MREYAPSRSSGWGIFSNPEGLPDPLAAAFAGAAKAIEASAVRVRAAVSFEVAYPRVVLCLKLSAPIAAAPRLEVPVEGFAANAEFTGQGRLLLPLSRPLPQLTCPLRRERFRAPAVPKTLFDRPGPRARRRHKAIEIGCLAALAVGGYAAYQVLEAHGEFSAAAWKPFTQWGLWALLGEGLANNLRAATLTLFSSAVVGDLLRSGILAIPGCLIVP